ncbi:glutathione S-transferase family protein [Planktothrix sp. FACHB-1375]|uniref:Glutathione S-transferase family protein n=1 Tax=Aerosakkonema funiforme FACHB-1375 TaxID=2949571 RepID=A0A926VBP1_9CYAN|nr:glutathione S-transferase family protein [Aerosakkonema funiforme]MBD2180730.1 glutathione S-transferase family protein [Aerosakkonema funiforme FACHB-1375]
MLKLYHTPISPNSRRVWITLLEKQIPFELLKMELNGDQLQPDFLALNPFHHIPVLVDDDFTIVESLAILDYLEVKYPAPAMLPTDAKALATVRMVEMVTRRSRSHFFIPYYYSGRLKISPEGSGCLFPLLVVGDV